MIIFSQKNKGFTLIELLVVLALIVVLISVVISQDRTDVSRFLYEDVAYRVALSVRQVQSYGIAAREYTAVGGGSSSFCGAYGIRFNLATPDRYTIFNDPGGAPTAFVCPANSGQYNVGDPILETVVLKGGVVIGELCHWNSVGTRSCNPGVSIMDIAFQRPNPEPLIVGNNNYRQACVGLSFPGGIRWSIMVRRTGQVSVIETACPL